MNPDLMPGPEHIIAFQVITLALAAGLGLYFIAWSVHSAWVRMTRRQGPEAYRYRNADRYRTADVKCIYQHDGTMWRAFVRAPERDRTDLPSTAKHQGDLY